MKKFTFKLVAVSVSAILLFSVTAFPHPQPTRRPFCGFNLRNGFYYQAEQQEYITREGKRGDKSGIPEVVEKIEASIGIDVPIAVYIAKDEDNCFATILQGGKRVLIADQLFLVKVNKESGTQWAAISIIAHEIGHHIAGFSRRATEGEGELDADYWSGYALSKLGASKNASVKAIMTYGTEKDTDSHPNKYSRSEAIKKGWDDAKGGSYDKDRCESCGF